MHTTTHQIPHILLLTTLLLLSLPTLIKSQVLHTSQRWILNSSNTRTKLRCVNWAGASEVNIPEGLQHQSVSTITSWIANAGFNCVRLTYSIDMALNPSQSVSSSFSTAATETGAGSALTDLYTTAVGKNSWLASSTTRGAFAEVISSLEEVGVMVILDNHVSKAEWCCSTTDGNGWWASASGYNAANSQYFDTANWLAGLKAMAEFAASYSNVVGMSLRNELRAVGSQDGNDHADWYDLITQGAEAIHDANVDVLVVVGGVNYATDLSFVYDKQLDTASIGIQDKLVWEFHSYSWSNSDTDDCSAYTTDLGNSVGYLLSQNQAYTGPLWLSEFGWTQSSPSSAEKTYYTCLIEYMENNDADWSVWALQGSYYVRSGTVNYDETFGILNSDWSGWRNSNFISTIGTMWTVNQTP